MHGSKRELRISESRVPKACVVVGGTAPSWGRVRGLTDEAVPSGPNYERVANPAGAIAFLLGFWQLIAIMTMGIAMIWSAAVLNGP